VTRGSTCTIQTLGLVGAKYIEITLPTLEPGQPPPPPLAENEVIVGQDPVRVELVLNDVAIKVNKLIRNWQPEEMGNRINSVLDHSDVAAQNIKAVSIKLNKNMDKFVRAADNVATASSKFSTLADSARSTTGSATAFFNEGRQTLDNIDALAAEWKGTGKRMNKILDSPTLSKDIKETMELAKQTADSVGVAIHDLNTTLKDQPVRQDLLTVLHSIDRSTTNIAEATKTLNELARDEKLRAEIQQTVADAKEAMSKVGSVLAQPEFKVDVKKTLTSIREAADNVDVAAQQIRQVLNKRAPLLHMMFGRPGRIKPENGKAEGDSTETREPEKTQEEKGSK
ncbi:MAG TPA: hypothetical protein V6D08_14495, partial [Candidatus Obscuribacterales bacterium]